MLQKRCALTYIQCN